jgi:hypothetical protein
VEILASAGRKPVDLLAGIVHLVECGVYVVAMLQQKKLRVQTVSLLLQEKREGIAASQRRQPCDIDRGDPELLP